jgi:transcriptional regulator with XRE-family HTH domain
MYQGSKGPIKQLYTQLGRLIRDAREKKGFTQAGLAEATSLSRTTITNIEKGRQHPPIHTLYTIANALTMKVADLLPELQTSPMQSIEAEKIPQDLDKREREWIQGAVSSTEREMRGEK